MVLSKRNGDDIYDFEYAVCDCKSIGSGRTVHTRIPESHERGFLAVKTSIPHRPVRPLCWGVVSRNRRTQNAPSSWLIDDCGQERCIPGLSDILYVRPSGV